MKCKTLLFSVVAVVLIATGSYADVTIKSTLENKGMVGIVNMEGSETHMISGEKGRTDYNIKMTNKVVKFFGGGKPQESSDIIRVDKELFWKLELKDKRYEEETFTQFREQMEKAINDSKKEQGQGKSKQQNDSIQVRMEVKVDRTGKHEKIAGYDAEQVVVTATTYGKNTESGDSGKFEIDIEYWVGKDVPGEKDAISFYKAMGSKMGTTTTSQQTSYEGMLTAYGIDAKEIQRKVGDLKGYPLRTIVGLRIEVDSLKQQAQDSQKGEEAEKKEEPKKESKSEEGGVAGKMKGLFGKKKESKKSEEQPKEPKSEQTGPVYLFRFVSTVTEISTSAIPADAFEIPAGFKKK